MEFNTLNILTYIVLIILIYYIATQEMYLTKIRKEKNMYEEYLKQIVEMYGTGGTGGTVCGSGLGTLIEEISNYFKNIEITEKANQKIEEFKNKKTLKVNKINEDAF